MKMLLLSTLALAVIAITSTGCDQLTGRTAALELEYQKASADLEALNQKAERTRKVQGYVFEEDSARLLELQETQMRLLEELIVRSRDKKEAFRLEKAKLLIADGDYQQATEILDEIANPNAPGYLPAHLWRATQLFESKTSGLQRTGNLDNARRHLKQVLTRDGENQDAVLLHAKILTEMQDYGRAYDAYETLFDSNPGHFREMVRLNKLLGREEQNQSVYEKALANYQALANQKEIQTDDSRWIMIETGIAKTLGELGRFEEVESRIEPLIKHYTADPQGGPRRVFLERLLTNSCVEQAGKVTDPKAQLELYTKAYRLHPGNVALLQSIARLSLSPDAEIASQAKSIYDPTMDIDPPAAVFNLLGSNALINKQFSKAIRYYERARGKLPRDPAILNNLAFAFLVAEDERNPERALQLVNEAIRHVPKDIAPVEKAKFFHTKATALKQMDRLQEALQLFEKSLKARPMHVDTLQSLVACYEGLNKRPPEQYLERLKGN